MIKVVHNLWKWPTEQKIPYKCSHGRQSYFINSHSNRHREHRKKIKSLWGFAPTPATEKDCQDLYLSQPWNTSKRHQVSLKQTHLLGQVLSPPFFRGILDGSQLETQNRLSRCFEVTGKPLCLQDWWMYLGPSYRVHWGSGWDFPPSQGSSNMKVHLSFFIPFLYSQRPGWPPESFRPS